MLAAIGRASLPAYGRLVVNLVPAATGSKSGRCRSQRDPSRPSPPARLRGAGGAGSGECRGYPLEGLPFALLTSQFLPGIPHGQEPLLNQAARGTTEFVDRHLVLLSEEDAAKRVEVTARSATVRRRMTVGQCFDHDLRCRNPRPTPCDDNSMLQPDSSSVDPWKYRAFSSAAAFWDRKKAFSARNGFLGWPRIDDRRPIQVSTRPELTKVRRISPDSLSRRISSSPTGQRPTWRGAPRGAPSPTGRRLISARLIALLAGGTLYRPTSVRYSCRGWCRGGPRHHRGSRNRGGTPTHRPTSGTNRRRGN